MLNKRQDNSSLTSNDHRCDTDKRIRNNKICTQEQLNNSGQSLHLWSGEELRFPAKEEKEKNCLSLSPSKCVIQQLRGEKPS